MIKCTKNMHATLSTPKRRKYWLRLFCENVFYYNFQKFLLILLANKEIVLDSWNEQLCAFFENNEKAKLLFSLFPKMQLAFHLLSTQLFISRVSHVPISKLKWTYILENENNKWKHKVTRGGAKKYTMKMLV
jgi:hypothetical protein